MTHLEFECSDEKALFILKAARLYDEGLRNLPDWISCDERLPKEDESVLVQPRWADEKFELIIAWRGVNMWTGTDGWGHENGYLDNDEVIAWMPLPTLYKKEGAE